MLVISGAPLITSIPNPTDSSFHSDDSRSEGGGICCRQAASVLRADNRFLNDFAVSE